MGKCPSEGHRHPLLPFNATCICPKYSTNHIRSQVLVRISPKALPGAPFAVLKVAFSMPKTPCVSVVYAIWTYLANRGIYCPFVDTSGTLWGAIGAQNAPKGALGVQKSDLASRVHQWLPLIFLEDDPGPAPISPLRHRGPTTDSLGCQWLTQAATCATPSAPCVTTSVASCQHMKHMGWQGLTHGADGVKCIQMLTCVGTCGCLMCH